MWVASSTLSVAATKLVKAVAIAPIAFEERWKKSRLEPEDTFVSQSRMPINWKAGLVQQKRCTGPVQDDFCDQMTSYCCTTRRDVLATITMEWKGEREKRKEGGRGR
jgi:hypothetical protein